MGKGKLDPRLWTFWGKRQELSISDAAYLICDQLPRENALVDDDPMIRQVGWRLYDYARRNYSRAPDGGMFIPSILPRAWRENTALLCAMRMIVRDRMAPLVVHRELCRFPEYRGMLNWLGVTETGERW